MAGQLKNMLIVSPVSFLQPCKLVAHNAKGGRTNLIIIRMIMRMMEYTRAPCRGLSLTSPMNKSMSSTLIMKITIFIYTAMFMMILINGDTMFMMNNSIYGKLRIMVLNMIAKPWV